LVIGKKKTAAAAPTRRREALWRSREQRYGAPAKAGRQRGSDQFSVLRLTFSRHRSVALAQDFAALNI